VIDELVASQPICRRTIKMAFADFYALACIAGVPRKPGMTRDDLFNTNASIVHTLAKACAKYAFEIQWLLLSSKSTLCSIFL
jgi:malate dehydrogenase